MSNLTNTYSKIKLKTVRINIKVLNEYHNNHVVMFHQLTEVDSKPTFKVRVERIPEASQTASF